MHKNGDNNDNNNSSAASQACAACKYQRRKCNPNCILAPFFPPSRAKDFLNAHKLFGVSNIKKSIETLDPPQRAIAMKSIIYQANMRASDPVGGCYRYIFELQSQIEWITAELNLVNQRLAICKAQAAAAAAAASQEQPLMEVGQEEEVNPILGLEGLNNAYVDQQRHEAEKHDQGKVYEGSTSSLSQVYNVFDTNSVKLEMEASVPLSDISEDIKPLLAVFDDKGAEKFPFDSKVC
ncbi:hypothetical protein CCACVL1_00553, partial [Corchorus capsularis]